MGDYMTLIDGHVSIAASCKAGAFQALKEWEKREIESFPFYGELDYPPLDHAQSLEEALHALGWEAVTDSDGNIARMYFEGDEQDKEDAWLKVLAPYVAADSYLIMESDYGEIWQWYFNGQTCTKYPGKFIFPGCPGDPAPILHQSSAAPLEKSKPRTSAAFDFEIRETYVRNVTIEANSLEEAQERIYQEFPVGMCSFTRDNFDGAEFLCCCSECGSTFTEDKSCYLTEVDSGTPQVRVLCERCSEEMEASGELTRCDCCDSLFSPLRLQVNPLNGEREICPLCGKVWCN